MYVYFSLFLLLFILCLRRAWSMFPNENPRLCAIQQATNIFAVRPHQQHGYNYRKEDERHRRIAVSTIDTARKDGDKDRKDTTRYNRGKRHIVIYHKYQHPHAETVECDVGLNTRNCTDKRSNTLTALKTGKDRKDVTDDSHKDGDNFQVNHPRRRNIVVVAHQCHHIDRHKTFQKVYEEHRDSSTLAQHTKHIRRACIFATVLADIHAIVTLANPHRTRQRAEQICYD